MSLILIYQSHSYRLWTHFSTAFDLKYVIQHYKKLLLCIHISGIHCTSVQYCIQIMYTAATKLCTILHSNYVHLCVQIMYVPVMLSQRIRLVMIFPQEENNLSRSAETYKIKNSRQTFFKGVVILVMVQVSICRINLNKKYWFVIKISSICFLVFEIRKLNSYSFHWLIEMHSENDFCVVLWNKDKQ